MARESKDDIFDEAKKRFTRCKEYYAEANRRFVEDYKFANGDSDNLWQWPQKIYQDRLSIDSPSLTINKVRQHNLQIVNDAKQNKPGIAINATGGGATFEAAQALEGICRHIEYQSNAQAAYDLASTYQVVAGVGYWRVVTDYIDEMSFDQEIFIRPINDPTGVFLDPDAKEPDKSDARFGFIFEDIPKDKFERDYPQFKGKVGTNTLDSSTNDGWITDTHVRRCEYYRVVETDDWLIQGTLNNQPVGPVLGKELKDSQGMKEELLAMADDPESGVLKRRTSLKRVEYKFIVGNEIVEQNLWLGSTVPIVQVTGEETFIDGKFDRKGHTRALKDAQRIYNYASSAAVEYGALQTKVPWLGPAQTFQGYEDFWRNANKRNWPYLPWNHLDQNGQPLPSPIRVEPPVAAPFFAAAMQTASAEMMMASGQYEAQLGQQGNERSGKAINERQRQGDNATYHFIDNLALAVRRTGKIILDLIPKVYDTERITMILAKDGETIEVKIDPQAKAAFQIERLEDDQTVKRILNPSVGRYEVVADVGPGYATQRQQAFDAFTTIITQAPNVTSAIADLLFQAADFPLSDEAAMRLKRMVPKEALGQGPSQNEQILMQQIEQMKGVMTELLNQVAQKDLQLKAKANDSATDQFKAITERLKVMADNNTDMLKVRDMVNKMVDEVLAEKARLEATDSQGLNPPTISESPGELSARMALKYGSAQ